MSLSLHNIKPSEGSTKKKKRVGRGNASGHGTYSCRGLKGQKSRTGSGKGRLKRLGLKMTLARIPKKRGFKSLQPKNQVVNLVDINKNFKDGETVNLKTLLQRGLIDNTEVRVKILGNGKLSVKNLKFEGVKMSETVVEAVGSDSEVKSNALSKK